MFKWWMNLTLGMVLGFILAVSFATVAAKTGEVWLSCYAEIERPTRAQDKWHMVLKCGKGDIQDKVVLR
jgi:hypothetical protein